jgi:predicted amino acid-binding ACT domain protein
MPPREASNAPTSPSPADQLKRIDIGQDGKETTEDERLRTFVLGEVEKAKKKLSPQALDRLVKAIAEVLSRRESDRAKIREAVQAKLKELSVDVEEQKTLKNIPLHMADRIRDYIPGDFRLKMKNELDEVDSLTPTELTKLKAELESHPKKLEKFIHGWARDHQWRASVRKEHPASFRILTEMFDGYCKKYDIKNPEGDIGEIFDKRAKVEKLRAKLREKTKELEIDIVEVLEMARK